MKKFDLVHTTILIIAVLAGYSAMEYLFYLLSSLAYTGEAYHATRQFSERSVYFLIMIVLYAAACVFLVKNSRKYAGLLLKDEPEGSWEDASKWQLDRSNIILVLFLGIGLYVLVHALPYAVNDLYDLFKSKVDSSMFSQDSTKRDSLIIELLRIVVGALLVYAAPNLTQFIERTIAVRLDGNDSRS